MRVLAGSIAARLLQAIATAMAVATLVFVAMQALPGDLATHVAAARYGSDRIGATTIEELRRTAGLDRPILIQYGVWLGEVARFDLGRSLITDRPVPAELGRRIGLTLQVGGLALLLALLFAVPPGVAAGLAPQSRVDRTVQSLAALLASAPSFVIGSLLIAVLAIKLRWLPVAGSEDLAHLILPSVSLGLSLAPGLALVVRHAVAGVHDAFFVHFAAMRGVAPWRIVAMVATRPALVPIVAYAPVLVMHVLEGFVTIELVFNLDGIGTMLVSALMSRDLPVIMGAGVIVTAMLALANLATDLALYALDPRMRSASP